jgi:hypothetical protein
VKRFFLAWFLVGALGFYLLFQPDLDGMFELPTPDVEYEYTVIFTEPPSLGQVTSD